MSRPPGPKTCAHEGKPLERSRKPLEKSYPGWIQIAITPMLATGKRHIKNDFPTPFPHRTRTLPSSWGCGTGWPVSARNG